MSLPQVRRGQIWVVDGSPGRGSEQLGVRPAVVIQTNAANSNPRYPKTIVVTLSSKGLPVATHVKVEPDAKNGLRKTSWVKCEQILTVSKSRLIKLIGALAPDKVEAVEAALGRVLALDDR